VRFVLEQIRESFRLLRYDPQLHPLIGRTLHLALESTGIALVIGLLPAYLIGSRQSRWARWAHTLANVGLGLPPVAVGVLLVPMLPGRTPWGGNWVGTMNGMIYGQTLLALPIIVALGATAILTTVQQWGKLRRRRQRRRQRRAALPGPTSDGPVAVGS
jgi:tungstate transport system permease protein